MTLDKRKIVNTILGHSTIDGYGHCTVCKKHLPLHPKYNVCEDCYHKNGYANLDKYKKL